MKERMTYTQLRPEERVVPLRAMTRISTARSWVNISSLEMAAILAQVGQYYFGVNRCAP